MTIFVRSLLGLFGLSASCCSIVLPVSFHSDSKTPSNTHPPLVALQQDRREQISSIDPSVTNHSGLTFDNLWAKITQDFNNSRSPSLLRVNEGPIKSEFHNIIQQSSVKEANSNWSVIAQEGKNCVQISSTSQNICGYLHLQENKSVGYKLGITYDGNQWKVKVVRQQVVNGQAAYGNLTQSTGVNKNRDSFKFEDLNGSSKDLGDDIQESIQVSLSQGK